MQPYLPELTMTDGYASKLTPRFAAQILGAPTPSAWKSLGTRYDLDLHPLQRDSAQPGQHRGDRLQQHAPQADLFVAYPGHSLFDLVSLASEGEVYHPMMQHRPDAERSRIVKEAERLHRMHKRDGKPVDPHHNQHIKPVVVIGSEAEWKPLSDLFAPIAEQGLLRDAVENFFPRFDSLEAAQPYLAERLKEASPKSRAHRTMRNQALQHEVAAPESRQNIGGASQRSEPSIAFFGSATTNRPEALAEAREMAGFCADRWLNIIHGGGSGGVMGALTAGANAPELVLRDGRQILGDRRPYVHGITAHPKGAHALYGTEGIGAGLSRITLARDMNQRIKIFESAHAFNVLRGGIGTVQEILQVAEDKANNDPRLSFVDHKGKRVAKPLIVYSPDGLYAGLESYLKEREPRLAAQIEFVPTLAAMQERNGEFLERHRPSHPEIEASRAEAVLKAIGAEKHCWGAARLNALQRAPDTGAAR